MRLTVLAVFLAALAFYLPFNAYIPVTDPVESNYALTAKEMVNSGDWLSPRIYGKYWFDKPIMIYWLIAGSYKIFGVGEFAARFPAALFSAASVAFAYWFAHKIFASRQIALLSAVMLATSLEFWVLARMIITDAVLFFFTSVSLAGFYLGLQGLGKIWYVLAYGAAGLAVLTKGPIGLLLPGLIIFIYIIVTRRWPLIKRLYLIPGLTVFLLVAAPWYFLMYQAHGSDFIDTFLGLHNYLRATVSEHPQDNVFYYYLVLFPVSLLPWTGVFLAALARGWRKANLPHFAYLTSWLAVIIVFYTLMATKYPTYVFPATFPAALLTGHFLNDMRNSPGRKQWLWLTVPTIILLVIIIVGIKQLPAGDGWLPVSLVALAAGVLILWLQVKGNTHRLPVTTAVVALITSFLLLYYGFEPLAWSRSAKAVAQSVPLQGAEVAAYGDYATSLVFYSGYNAPRLVTHYDNAGGTWSGKYTMPVELASSFDLRTQNNPQTYILVKANAQNEFQQQPLAQKFVPVNHDGTMILYKRIHE